VQVQKVLSEIFILVRVRVFVLIGFSIAIETKPSKLQKKKKRDHSACNRALVNEGQLQKREKEALMIVPLW